MICGPFRVEFPTGISPVVEGHHHVSVEDQGLSIPGGLIPSREVHELGEASGSKADGVSSTRVEGAVCAGRPFFTQCGDGSKEVPSGFGVVP